VIFGIARTSEISLNAKFPFLRVFLDSFPSDNLFGS
jgi:hypothetical protein